MSTHRGERWRVIWPLRFLWLFWSFLSSPQQKSCCCGPPKNAQNGRGKSKVRGPAPFVALAILHCLHVRMLANGCSSSSSQWGWVDRPRGDETSSECVVVVVAPPPNKCLCIDDCFQGQSKDACVLSAIPFACWWGTFFLLAKLTFFCVWMLLCWPQTTDTFNGIQLVRSFCLLSRTNLKL